MPGDAAQSDLRDFCNRPQRVISHREPISRPTAPRLARAAGAWRCLLNAFRMGGAAAKNRGRGMKRGRSLGTAISEFELDQ